MLLGTGAMTLALYTTSLDAQRYQFTSARYLLPLYLTTPILFGALWRYTAPVLRPLATAALSRAQHMRAEWYATFQASARVSVHRPFRAATAIGTPTEARRARASGRTSSTGGRSRLLKRPGASLAAFALILLCALSVYGGFLSAARALDTSQFAQPLVPTDQALLAYLDAHHITAFYSDYWTCYRLTFETSERLLCAVRGQNGDVSLELINNRNDDYIRRMAQVPHPAYLLPAGTPEDADFVAEARAAGIPYVGYQRTLVAGYAIYSYP